MGIRPASFRVYTLTARPLSRLSPTIRKHVKARFSITPYGFAAANPTPRIGPRSMFLKRGKWREVQECKRRDRLARFTLKDHLERISIRRHHGTNAFFFLSPPRLEPRSAHIR
jgi:hypothetical protein